MRIFLRAISYFRDDLPRILLQLGLIILQTLFGLLSPFPMYILLDSVLASAPNSRMHRIFVHFVHTDNRVIQITILALATLLLRVFKEVIGTIQNLLRIKVGYFGLMRVRCDLFRKLEELSASCRRAQPQGDAIYRVSYDTFGFQTMLSIAMGVLLNVLTLVTMAWIMFSMNWRLTLLALSIAPLLMWTIKRYGKVLEERSTRAHESDAELTMAIQRSVASIGLVQAFGREAEEYARFHNTVRNSVNTWLKLHWHEVMYWLWIGMIFALSGSAIFGYGGYLIFLGALPPRARLPFLSYLSQHFFSPHPLTGTHTPHPRAVCPG